MSETLRLKLILIGLFLAALALGYFIFSQRQKTANFQSEQRSLPPIVVQGSPSPSPMPTSSPDSLPSTGAPEVLISIFGTCAVLIGWSLRRFPK